MKYLHQISLKKLARQLLWGGAIALSTMPISVAMAIAQTRKLPYQPPMVTVGADINDILTDKDIPTGQKGFARDYLITAVKDQRLEIAVNGAGFDTVLSLLDSKGEVIVENDDIASDDTNSQIFFRVRQNGTYTIRVSSFGGSSGGKFTLMVNKLQVVKGSD
jgi:hypothetical protein